MISQRIAFPPARIKHPRRWPPICLIEHACFLFCRLRPRSLADDRAPAGAPPNDDAIRHTHPFHPASRPVGERASIRTPPSVSMWGGIPGLLALRASSSLHQPLQVRRPEGCEPLDRSSGAAPTRSSPGPLWSECTVATRGRRVWHVGWWRVTRSAWPFSRVEQPRLCKYTAPVGSVCTERSSGSRRRPIPPDLHCRFSQHSDIM